MGTVCSKDTTADSASRDVVAAPVKKADSPKKKAAVLLAGNGVYDGSECTETVSILIHLDKHGAEISNFAPTMKHTHIVDHTAGEPMEDESRCVLKESARIARGKIADISTLKAEDFDVLLIPGGFGVAKNLSSFAFDGADMKVIPEVERVLKEFHAAKKPIGFACIAPILGSRVFPGAELTVGKKTGDDWPYQGTAEACEKMGAKIIEKEKDQWHVDKANKFVSAPSYMNANTPYGIYTNLGNLVTETLKLA